LDPQRRPRQPPPPRSREPVIDLTRFPVGPFEEPGILPDQWIRKALDSGWVTTDRLKIPEANIQPASLDLRLGEKAYRLRCSFLPEDATVADKLERYSMGEVDLRDEGILERNRPYLIPLVEGLSLPPGLRARANPRSSTGRVDIFTRVITDRSHRFDEIESGYHGPLYLEVVSRSFTVKVREGLSLNQLRLLVGDPRCSDADVLRFHTEDPILFNDDKPVPREQVAMADGLFLSLNLADERGLAGGSSRQVGWRAKKNSRLLDLTRPPQSHATEDYWEPVVREGKGSVVLEPEEFYILGSREKVRIPPTFAAEMNAYDPTSGELRTHYAGFFDPGFGHTGADAAGTWAVMEVRAHDVPFMVEHGQRFCKLGFERMLEVPTTLYGENIGSSYQHQRLSLSKHFAPDRPAAHQPTLLPE
jgi:dCTP deaminase